MGVIPKNVFQYTAPPKPDLHPLTSKGGAFVLKLGLIFKAKHTEWCAFHLDRSKREPSHVKYVQKNQRPFVRIGKIKK